VSQSPDAAINVPVDVRNPGQFFACCGLLELAARLINGVDAWFENGSFKMSTSLTLGLRELLCAAHQFELDTQEQGSPAMEEDEGGSDVAIDFLAIARPIALRLDWWSDKSLKTWAGSMNARLIFLAMCRAISTDSSDPLNQAQVIYDPQETTSSAKHSLSAKKREPFYFDARRGASALAIDVGFAPDALQLTTTAYPAVESLAMVGLQRCRPMPTDSKRVFEYYTWNVPLDASIAPAAVCGLLPYVGARGFRFQNAFRTDQRKHKAFTPATPL